MKFAKFAISILASLSLAACVAGSEQGASTSATKQVAKEPPRTPEFFASKGFQNFTYSASGKTYVVYFKRDRLARADKIVTHVTRGTPFTATTADDAEVQNMLRDAYRAQDLCGAGLHPGLIDLGYGPFIAGDVPMWSAYVRCSEKKQENT